jgi:predicted Zn-dependent protease
MDMLVKTTADATESNAKAQIAAKNAYANGKISLRVYSRAMEVLARSERLLTGK